MAKKPTLPRHKYGVMATKRGWECKKTGELLKCVKGLLEYFPPKEAPKPKKKKAKKVEEPKVEDALTEDSE